MEPLLSVKLDVRDSAFAKNIDHAQTLAPESLLKSFQGTLLYILAKFQLMPQQIGKILTGLWHLLSLTIDILTTLTAAVSTIFLSFLGPQMSLEITFQYLFSSHELSLFSQYSNNIDRSCVNHFLKFFGTSDVFTNNILNFVFSHMNVSITKLI